MRGASGNEADFSSTIFYAQTLLFRKLFMCTHVFSRRQASCRRRRSTSRPCKLKASLNQQQLVPSSSSAYFSSRQWVQAYLIAPSLISGSS